VTSVQCYYYTEEIYLIDAEEQESIAWRDRGKPAKNIGHDSEIPVEIRTKYLPNTNLEHYRYANLLG
jgi:hypothetical protein